MNEAGEIQSLSSPFEPSVDPIKFTKKPKIREMTKDSMQAYLGSYELSGIELKIYFIGDSTLTFFIPGQPEYKLLPTGKDLFAFEALTGYSIKFIRDENNEVNEILLQQPNGNFKAKRKKN